MFNSSDAVAWAVPPGKKNNTRPVKFVEGLEGLGIIGADAKYFFHGRAKSNENNICAGSVVPAIPFPLNDSVGDLCVLSPVFFLDVLRRSCRWIDFYDDWSIAPDINFIHRLYSSATYYAIKKELGRARLVTCNTKYMAGKIGFGKVEVIPNGVDENIGFLRREGDARRRLIILGNFFDGRTDFNLISRIVNSGAFEHIVFGGIGGSRKILKMAKDVRDSSNIGVDIFDWLSAEQLAKIIGSHTVGMVPHIVSDYTLSQDPMKIYQFLALGMGVICPRLLWPDHVGKENAFLVDYGADLSGERVGEWVDYLGMAFFDRKKFCDNNGWSARVNNIAECLRGRV